MVMKEYKIKDASGRGFRTFQWNTDEFPDLPKGAKVVGEVESVETPEGANPDPALASQEPGNVLDESARGQASQADVDAAAEAAKAEEAEKATKAGKAPENKSA